MINAGWLARAGVFSKYVPLWALFRSVIFEQGHAHRCYAPVGGEQYRGPPQDRGWKPLQSAWVIAGGLQYAASRSAQSGIDIRDALQYECIQCRQPVSRRD